MEIKVLQAGDDRVLGTVLDGVFDGPLDCRTTKEFLSDSRHHIVVAVENGAVVGFASAVHYVHPDKPSPELWVNEVGIATSHRERGLGKAIIQSLLDLARKLGCAEAWVLTDRMNTPAMRLYSSSGGGEARNDQVMFTFRLKDLSP
jgi:aminoglycoside 6'-N-acetyltransferase I